MFYCGNILTRRAGGVKPPGGGKVPGRVQDGLATTELWYYPTIQYVYWCRNYYKLDTPLALTG